MQKLNQKEQDFLFNELAPIQYESLKDSTEKEYLKFIIESHNIKNHTPFNEVLESFKLSRENYFNKALFDTLNLVFDEKNKDLKVIKFKLLNEHKKDLLYLLEFDIFSNNKGKIRPTYLCLLLKHLCENIYTIKNYRNRPSDNAGTAYFNNTSRNGIQSVLSDINNQLDLNSPFHAVSKKDKNRLNVSKNLVTMFKEDTQEANLLIILNSMFSHELYNFPFLEGEKEGLKQSFDFLNGIPTSKDIIVRSFIIKISLPYKNKTKINKTKLCRIIKGIAKTFFNDIVFNEEKNTYRIGITPRYLKYHTFIRTSFEGNKIYEYDKNEEYHFLFKSSLNEAIEKYSKILIEEGHHGITKNKYYKSTLKKLFKSSILAL